MSMLKNHYLAQEETKSWLYVYDYDDALLINLSFIHSDLAGVRTSNERKGKFCSKEFNDNKHIESLARPISRVSIAMRPPPVQSTTQLFSCLICYWKFYDGSDIVQEFGTPNIRTIERLHL
ncbi:unnamed protein product [Trifolium pratense]|uniref:Uncharacterized protein n=1 Tax=Trifolium pratense TaxID=57577 RepID=A0ACB0JMY2_TRIPR|nr:unnamed protein product [Trifolium pratense]